MYAERANTEARLGREYLKHDSNFSVLSAAVFFPPHAKSSRDACGGELARGRRAVKFHLIASGRRRCSPGRAQVAGAGPLSDLA
ncbi:hypothetical protein EVAR_2973_1 [Eumeta japonica]|uniref:Uncharacterized protein n=1 Tax=Eumeta variegata TaxID=151549 RepID=A0A4C1SU70_EUMVA|nr:hypothetical protein EVAR_2973_1 [Eumeta japonica]